MKEAAHPRWEEWIEDRKALAAASSNEQLLLAALRMEAYGDAIVGSNHYSGACG